MQRAIAVLGLLVGTAACAGMQPMAQGPSPEAPLRGHALVFTDDAGGSVVVASVPEIRACGREEARENLVQEVLAQQHANRGDLASLVDRARSAAFSRAQGRRHTEREHEALERQREAAAAAGDTAQLARLPERRELPEASPGGVFVHRILYSGPLQPLQVLDTGSWPLAGEPYDRSSAAQYALHQRLAADCASKW